MLPRKIGVRMTMKKTTGKTNKSFEELFNIQLTNQEKFLLAGIYDKCKSNESIDKIPVDDVGLFSYHIQQLMSEIGEVLEADKRWKSHRNDKNDSASKLEEIADCFIVLMNVAMFSGFDGSDLEDAVAKKLKLVSDRFDK